MTPISRPAAASTTIQSPTNGSPGSASATAANATASAQVTRRGDGGDRGDGAPGRERDEHGSERRGGDDADGERLAASHAGS